MIHICFETASCHMIYLTSFMKIGTAVQVILRFLPQQFERLSMLVLLMGGIFYICCSNGLRWHGICTKFCED
jgi:hypothetical protein